MLFTFIMLFIKEKSDSVYDCFLGCKWASPAVQQLKKNKTITAKRILTVKIYKLIDEL